jgi:hypothetical protein
MQRVSVEVGTEILTLFRTPFEVVHLAINRYLRIPQRLNTVVTKLTMQHELTNSFLEYPG